MRILKVLNNEEKTNTFDYTPIWIMRQAGRYLPEYRKIRIKVKDFNQLYRNPELATEITLQPLKRFPLDAAIIFSDILIALEAIGLKVKFETNKGPVLYNPINKDIKQVSSQTDLNNYDYLSQSIKAVKRELKPYNIPLIGFIGSPWTLAAYAVEGQGSKSFTKLRRMVYVKPQLIHKLLERLSVELSQLAIMQIKNGADIIQIFDSWAGLLNSDYYRMFSLAYITKVIARIKATAPETPIILFAKGSPLQENEMAQTKVHCLGIDWQKDLAKAFSEVGRKLVLQGNMDPAVLYGDKNTVNKEVKNILGRCPRHGRHIFNLGHGIYPDINPDSVAYLVDIVHELSSSST